jgi:hypothetical protein
MSDEIQHELTAITDALAQLRTDAAREVATAAIDRHLAAFDARHAEDDAPATLAMMRTEFEHRKRSAYDADLQERARQLEARHGALVSGIDNVMAVLKQVPPEKDPQVDALRQLTAQQRYQGRTRAELLKAYHATPDGSNPTFVRMVEDDIDGFRLTLDPDTDASAALELQQAIRTRQAARVPKPLSEARASAAGLLKPVSVAHLLSHLKTGRGVATVGTSTTLRAV